MRNLLPWFGVAAVFTTSYWFPPIYRVLPTAFWMAFIVAVGAWGVWRWVAYFAGKRE